MKEMDISVQRRVDALSFKNSMAIVAKTGLPLRCRPHAYTSSLTSIVAAATIAKRCAHSRCDRIEYIPRMLAVLYHHAVCVAQRLR